MKIAIVGTVASSILGFRRDLIKMLVCQGHQVFAFSIDYSDEQRSELISWGVIPVDYNMSRSGLNPFSDLKMMIVLRSEFKRIEPDVVFSYFSKPAIYATLAARLAKVPKRIAMLEGLGFAFTEQPDGQSLKTKIIKKIQIFLYRLAFSASTNVVFLNTDDRNELLITHRIKSNTVDVLGGIGVDLNLFKYKEPATEKVRFLFIGRLLKEKGILDFLQAAEKVKFKYSQCDFIVLGSTDTTSPNALSKKDLKYYIDNEIISYPGQVTNVSEWVEKSSVFVLPSYREGVPRSTQEAMAIGRPILTTDVPGCRETVVIGENGFLVPAFNVDRLADRMIWFIEHPDRIEPMGRVSRRMAEDLFDIRTVNAKLLDIMGL